MTARFTLHDFAWIVCITLLVALWVGGCVNAEAQEPTPAPARITHWRITITYSVPVPNAKPATQSYSFPIAAKTLTPSTLADILEAEANPAPPKPKLLGLYVTQLKSAAKTVRTFHRPDFAPTPVNSPPAYIVEHWRSEDGETHVGTFTFEGKPATVTVTREEGWRE